MLILNNMDDIIKLRSRYKAKNYLERVNTESNKDSKTYVLRTDTTMVRVGYNNDGAYFIDPSGGPMIIVGSVLEEANAIVSSISFIKGLGYIITFK